MVPTAVPLYHTQTFAGVKYKSTHNFCKALRGMKPFFRLGKSLSLYTNGKRTVVGICVAGANPLGYKYKSLLRVIAFDFSHIVNSSTSGSRSYRRGYYCQQKS